jgi:cytoskeletal protein RodZ
MSQESDRLRSLSQFDLESEARDVNPIYPSHPVLKELHRRKEIKENEYNANKKEEENKRHESIVKKLEQLSKPKQLDIFVAIIVFLTFLATIAALYFQVYLPYRKSLDNPSLSDKSYMSPNTGQQKSPPQSSQSRNAENSQNPSSSIPPIKR